MKITTLAQAEEFLNSHIPQTVDFKFPGQLGLDRTKKLLTLLGDPQYKLNVVHIAGTSGKGSTAYMTAGLLQTHGFSVGLHVSPHLTDLRERFQIDGELIGETEVCRYLSEIQNAIGEVGKSEYGKPSYFEIVVALSFYIFYKKKVDYAVIETGLGGWYDGTNVVDNPNKLSIITRIGLDHTQILGNTLSKIALQKAHIINKNSTAITIRQQKSAQEVIENYSSEQKAKLIVVSTNKKLILNPQGTFQLENASLAIAALEFLSHRDKFAIDQEKMSHVLKTTTIKGRFEIFNKNGKTIVVDGAHNPQKMRAFTESLAEKFPGKKFTFLLAFKEGKDIPGMLKYIVPLAQKIIITQFWVDTTYSKLSLSIEPKKIAQALDELGYTTFEVVGNSQDALRKALKEGDSIVITGSLYFVGEVYSQVV